MNNHICRAKSLDTGEWVYGYYVSKTDPLIGCAYHYILSQEYNSETGLLDGFMTWHKVDPDTVCRFVKYIKNNTDTYDKLFEHDIVFCPNNIVGEIVWWDSNKYTGWAVCEFGRLEERGLVRFQEDMCFSERLANIKIVGNIFDNTELIEEEA